MNIPIVFAEFAIQDLEDMREYYSEQDLDDVGARFVREIVSLIEGLSVHPDRGRIVPEFDQPLLRELILPPFRIVYRRYAEKIEIVRVWRTERLLKLP